MELWACTQCRSLNTRSRTSCYGCGMPRDPEELATARGRVRPLHIFMGVAFALIAALTGISAMTLVSLRPPDAPRPTAPAIAAFPNPTDSVTPSISPSVPVVPTPAPSGSSAPTDSPTQTQAPTRTAPPQATAVKPSRVIKSSNWSGYGLRNKQYVSVSAEWTQPEVDCSAGDEANVSIWVGLDGVKSHSVEQTGTSADCPANGTRAVYYAWYEMYPEPMHRAPMLVRPGDRFSALVHELSAEKFELTLKNLTTDQSFKTSASRPGGWATSAEWVVEPAALCNPTCAGSQLAQFADVTFTSVAAETSDGSVVFATASSQLVQFDLRSKKGAQLVHVSSLAGDVPTFDIERAP